MTTQEQLEAIIEKYDDDYRDAKTRTAIETAEDNAISAITALIQKAVNEGRVAELKNLRNQDRFTNRDSYALKRIDELSGGSNNEK